MKISLNELQSVCRKAFMGMGFTAGHADDASAMVAWMQSYKLDGMKELSEGLECVVASAASARPNVIYQDADLAVVDGQDPRANGQRPFGHRPQGVRDLRVEERRRRRRAKA